MSSVDERRTAFVDWDSEFVRGQPLESEVRRTAEVMWATVISYFDEQEPSVADAIRYGLENNGYQNRYVGPPEQMKDAVRELGMCVPSPDDARWERQTTYTIRDAS